MLTVTVHEARSLSTLLGLYQTSGLLPLLNVCAQEVFIMLSSKHWEIIIQNPQYTEIGLYTKMLSEVKKLGAVLHFFSGCKPLAFPSFHHRQND